MMRNSQQPASSFHSSSDYIVVQISKGTALFLLGSLALFILFAVVLQQTASRHVAAVPNSAGSPVVATTGTPVAPLERLAAPKAPAPQQAEQPSSEFREPEQNSAAAPETAPVPATTVSRTVVKYYPVMSLPQYASPADADSSSPDNTSPDPAPQATANPVPDFPSAPPDASSPQIVNGAGTAFPYPLYSKWFDEFHRHNPEVQFNYQSVGSGAGIHQLVDKTVDFGASDEPMTDQQLAAAKVPIVHVPSVVNGIVPIYNLPEVTELRFTPEILAGIYSGKIIYWNDRAIAAANPHTELPGFPITVIHRSDGCAATFIFTDYLSKVSREWQQTVGQNTAVNWPIGYGGKGNEGVAELVRQTQGAIGYVEFVFAVQKELPFGSVRNSAHRFVKANLDSLTAAASLPNTPTDFRVSITDASRSDSYPIVGFTWFLAPTRSRSASEGKDLVAFFSWMLGPGQEDAGRMGYAPLPIDLRRSVFQEITQIH
jgi:phosphate transport system substrate-binding protein